MLTATDPGHVSHGTIEKKPTTGAAVVARTRTPRQPKAPKPPKAPRVTNAGKARAMYMSDKGATMAEIEAATGDTQYVVLQKFRKDPENYRVEEKTEINDKGKNVKRYFVLPLSLEAKQA